MRRAVLRTREALAVIVTHATVSSRGRAAQEPWKMPSKVPLYIVRGCTRDRGLPLESPSDMEGSANRHRETLLSLRKAKSLATRGLQEREERTDPMKRRSDAEYNGNTLISPQ